MVGTLDGAPGGLAMLALLLAVAFAALILEGDK
jgi:hypothetical protein